VVYRNIRNLDLGADRAHAYVIPETGEVDFHDIEIARKYRDKRHATEHRLGNITAIGFLRAEVTKLAGLDSVLIRKVLYSGTHSGDYILLAELPALSEELGKLAGCPLLSAELTIFLDEMEVLVRTARQENNPIVFL
jgi:hypothetical protein